MPNNQYKFFRTPRFDITAITPEGESAPNALNSVSALSKRYDEPTYMAFRVLFGQNASIWSGTSLFNTNYDRMPHPLFIKQKVDATQVTGNQSEIEFNRELYSTIDYLRDSNEFTRAEMLQEFITLWEDLQKNFQYYFQSIEGIGELLKINPERGKRVGNDVRLTFNMMEGIDQRISYLLNLYRKIAWDDTYQRWILPDMMRFFDIQIFVTEFRTFHKSTVKQNSDEPVYLQILNGILPTYLINCEMCEIDINTLNYSYREKLSINEEPEMANVSFQVKVGNVNEISTYPVFNHFIFEDKRLNGLDRSKEKGLSKNMSGTITNATDDQGRPIETDYVSTKSGDARYSVLDQVAQDTFFQKDHISGAGYIEKNTIQNLKNANPKIPKEEASINPLNESTWAGNAIKFGKAFAVNFATEQIEKAKMIKIPGLGFSFNEATSVIKSKDSIAVLGLIRKSLSKLIGGTEKPSSLLEGKIDNTFKEFLLGITLSDATDDSELELIKTAKLVLSNRGKWEEVKDLSYATDLIGPNEYNNPVTIEGGNKYKQFIELKTNGDKSLATDLDGEPPFIKTGRIIEGSPSSNATTKQKI